MKRKKNKEKQMKIVIQKATHKVVDEENRKIGMILYDEKAKRWIIEFEYFRPLNGEQLRQITCFLWNLNYKETH